MLILTRRKGQQIVIGDDIEIVVLSIQGNNVQLGIKAPKEVEVWRQEIYERILREREAAEG